MRARSGSPIKSMWLALQAFAALCVLPAAHADDAAQVDPFAVVVLPTGALSDDPALSQLADTLHEVLLARLATVDGIHVVDPALVRPYRDSELEPAEIATLLGAGTVIESSIRPGAAGASMRLRCFDVAADKLIFSTSTSRHRPDRDPHDRMDNWVAHSVESVEQGIYPDRRPDRASETESARVIFLDTSRAPAERLKALQKLRPAYTTGYPPAYIDGGAALGGDVAAAAVQLADQSEDAHIRAAIWRVMVGVGDTTLVQPLIHTLTNDPEPHARSAAAEALATHLDHSGVHESLTIAAETDASPAVRKAAYRATLSPDKLHAFLALQVTDASLPARDRQMALFNLTRLNKAYPAPLEAGQVAAMAQFAGGSNDPMIRRLAWNAFVQLAGNVALPFVLDALPEEPHEAVRDSMISSLQKFAHERSVHEVLEKAAADDLSPLVRDTAARVLRGDVQ